MKFRAAAFLRIQRQHLPHPGQRLGACRRCARGARPGRREAPRPAGGGARASVSTATAWARPPPRAMSCASAVTRLRARPRRGPARRRNSSARARSPRASSTAAWPASRPTSPGALLQAPRWWRLRRRCDPRRGRARARAGPRRPSSPERRSAPRRRRGRRRPSVPALPWTRPSASRSRGIVGALPCLLQHLHRGGGLPGREPDQRDAQRRLRTVVSEASRSR